MSKVITSPVKRWSGSVTLADPLTIQQAMAFEEALDNARKLIPEKVGSTPEEIAEWVQQVNAVVGAAKYLYNITPGICACVEKWELEGLGIVTPDNFPASPKISRALLVSWLMGEITKIYKEADEVPNA